MLLKLALALHLAGPLPGAAQTAPAPSDTLVVGTRVVPPFVMESDEGYTGLTVRLWDHIADRLELEYVFEERNLDGLFDGVEDGTLFASASALTVTAEREERVDFTHPFFTTGLGIAVPHQPAGLLQAVGRLFSLEFLWVFGLLGSLLLFWGALVWLFERVENPEEFGGTAAQGIGSGFWWAAVTMATVGYGDKTPRTLGGRIVGFIWMFTAIVVISFFTAAIASSLTVTQLDSRVSGREDLPQARVGGLEGAAAVSYLEADGIAVASYPSIEAGLEALAGGTLDAFVHDAPILRYYSRSEFQGRTRVLAGTFVEQYYGIALARDSEYRDRINPVLLEFTASEEWARLKQRLLGDD
ncbi:MAG: transporter substrate-binding domain-containing protein [Gemmatimonadota bacterium]|nr:transporter substrate-binding domain-containing protein [Gemmatimonadota bacterium]